MKLRIAVISDLHAHQKNRPLKSEDKENNVSYLPAYPDGSDHDPFSDLDTLIDEKKLKTDLLICPGDICDKGDITGFTYAWEKLHKLKSRLGARELISTCGNHDLDSRYATVAADDDPDPKGNLLQAKPAFPFGPSPETDQYWARNFAFLTPIKDVRVISLNTSAYHGGKDNELLYGRVSSRTIDAIIEKLKTEPPALLNILLCHHHLQPLPSWNKTSDDLQHVRKGIDLITELTAATSSTWLMIHGHRHIPTLSHSVTPPVVILGAGSFSRIGDSFTNQFHLIDVESDPLSKVMPLCGEIKSWNWSRPSQWAVYQDKKNGLPPQCGFGYAGGIPALVKEIVTALGSLPFLSWRDITQKVNELRFLTPSQWVALNKCLDDAGLIISDASGLPNQIGKKL